MVTRRIMLAVLLGLSLSTVAVWKIHVGKMVVHQRKVASDGRSCDTHYFDRDRLSKLSSTSGSIADILASAPDCFKMNQVAVYNSESLHCSTHRAPRILLYVLEDLDGTTVCSFNSGVKDDYREAYSKAEARGEQIDCHEGAMECETFKPDTNRFEFYEVKEVVSGDGKSIRVSNSNPAQCLTCHKGESFLGSPNPRPILEDYPTWPGFYGSMHDKFAATPHEKEKYFSEFLKYKPQNARYSTLPDVVSAEGKYSSENSKPIVNLHNLLESQAQRRIGAELTQADVLKRVWPFRYALLASLACDDDMSFRDAAGVLQPAKREFPIESYLTETLRKKATFSFAQIASTNLKLHLTNIEKVMRQHKMAGPVHFEQFEKQYRTDTLNDPAKPYTSYQLDDRDNFWNASRLIYLGKNLGFPVDEWSLTSSPTWDFEAGARNIRQVLPFIAPWLLDRTRDEDLSLSLETSLGIPPDAKQCETLRKKSLAALSADAAGAVTEWPTIEGVFVSSGISTVGPPRRLMNCIGCHVVGRAPSIPFDNIQTLRSVLGKPAMTNSKNTLLEEIKDRLDSGSMPPNGVLEETEKSQLKAYFEDVFKNSSLHP